MKSLDVNGRKILLQEKAKRILKSDDFMLNKLHSPLVSAMIGPVFFVLLLLFEDGAL